MRSENAKENQSKFSWGIVAFVGLILLLIVVGLSLFSDSDQPPALGEKVPDFGLTTYSGETINTTDLRGKVILINFWASWCVTCDEEAVLLEQAWQHYQETSTEIVFLGAAYMDTEVGALDYLDQYGVTYPNGPDLQGRISDIFQVSAVPETYLIDREGKLAEIKYGPFISLDEIINIVDRALSQ